jgi:crotonobetaine/carnitine-CoA ligase
MGRRCPVGDLVAYWARERPERLCCAIDERRFTFGEMDHRAAVLAAGTCALGVRKGDRVATLAPNRVEIVELFHGLARAGAIQVPLNAYLKGAFLRHQLAQSRAKVLITDEAGRRAVEPMLDELPDLETIIHLDAVAAPNRSGRRIDVPYDVLSLAGEVPPAVPIAAADTMSIVYTSGTTGLPKGCVLSHGYYCRSGQVNGDALQVTAEDVIFTALPLFHAGGRLITLMGPLYHGIPVQLETSFSASRYFARAAETGATIAIGVGAMGAALLATPPGSHDKDHALRTMMVAPMSPTAQRAFRERFGIEPWTDVYGQTECMPITATPVSSPRRDQAGCGISVPDLELALLDEDDSPVADGAVGEICLRPDTPFAMFDGYWDQPADTLDAFRQLWYHTGDYGRRLPSGALAFVDRKKDALRRRGENISSIELEAAIDGHPDIVESAILAVPSDLVEDDIRACIVTREGAILGPEPLFRYLKDNLPYYALPRYVEIVDDLPRNAVGRVMKHVLREQRLTERTWDFEQLGLVIERDERR